LQKDRCSNGDFSPSYYDKVCDVDEYNVADDISSNDDSDALTVRPYSVLDAYEWAFSYGITTMPTLAEAKISDAIIRAEMAKMISVFATKLFQKTPNTQKSACAQFVDLYQANEDLQSYIIESCQLGLMGMHGDGIGVLEAFSPTKTITRAEVGTILSRLLRGTEYATQA
jgi:hypothetical protein